MMITALLAAAFIDLSGANWTCDGEPVVVPHTWNAADACDGPAVNGVKPKRVRGGDSVGGTGYLKKCAVYRRDLPAKKAGKRYFLGFDGASVKADVRINGRAVGSHVGAFTAFAFEVTDFLREDSPSALEVAVDNRWDESTQPLSADYSVYGGLYRGVRLVETDPVCIDRVTDGADGVVVTADPQTGAVEVRVAVLGGTNEVQRFTVEKPELWSPEHPKLYTRRISVAQKGSIDWTDIRFAFRTFEFRDGLFYLNGKPRQLRGVNRHQDRAGKGWAVSAADEEEDLRLIKAMGADALRTAHYPQARHIYDLCDELGIICWVEYPNVNRVTFSEAFERGMLRQVREMVQQHRNHPCVAMWSIFNELYNSESWMRPHAGKLIVMLEKTRDLIHSLDPSRTVVGVSDTNGRLPLNGVPDEFGLNIYPMWYSDLTMREMLDWQLVDAGRKTFAISEYGVGASVLQHDNPAKRPNCSGPWHPEEYQAYRLHDDLLTMVREPRLWGTYVWAMFDFGADNRTEGDRHGINDKGLVTHDRKTCKDAYYMYQAAWTKTPVLHLVGSRLKAVKDDTLAVMGFSNVGPVTLKVNGQDLGTKTPDAVATVLWENVKLVPGDNAIELVAGGRTAHATWRLTK